MTQQTAEPSYILIAEDEPINFMLLQKMLEKFGYPVIWAKNGQEAVEHCASNSAIELVLMDIRMPIMDGLEATRQIRTLDPKLPIYAVTAYTLSNEKEKCAEAGASGFLSKPVRPSELADVVLSIKSIK